MFHWFAVWMGLSNASGGQYLFWSGIFGDTTILAGALLLYWKHTCHVGRCWRLGLHKVDGTPYTTCRTHHPMIDQTVKVTAATIGEAHEQANQ